MTRMIKNKSLVIFLALFFTFQLVLESKAGERHPWPFSVQKENRYLLDKNGNPYWLNGDAAWSLLVQPTLEEAEAFIKHRAKQGFNALKVNILERRYSDDPPRTTEGGIEPFLVSDDLRTPNETYFKRLDRLVKSAEKNGVTLLLFPTYLGYLNAGDGWYDVLLKNGIEACKEYARYVAERYANSPNVIWVIGGDHNPDDALEHLNAIAETILSVNPKAIISAHCHPYVSPRVMYNDAAWLNLSNVYHYGILHDAIWEEYNRRPVRPFFMMESTYENEWDSTPQQQRRQQWWALCGGATGGFIGNNPIWRMAKGWKEQWNSPAAQMMTVIINIIDTIPWSTYLPDQKREMLVSGWGEYHSTDRAGFAVGEKSAVGYFPSPREITLSVKEPASLKWINPADGKVFSESSVPSGKHILSTPGSQDMVLLVSW